MGTGTVAQEALAQHSHSIELMLLEWETCPERLGGVTVVTHTGQRRENLWADFMVPCLFSSLCVRLCESSHPTVLWLFTCLSASLH